MHEIERHRIILDAVANNPVATIARLAEVTGASEATIRRDVNALHIQRRLRRVRGGAEALAPPQQSGMVGRPFAVNESRHAAEKRAIARAAAALCADGESIIINGGTTTCRMVHALTDRRMQILTNSFPIAAHLLDHSRNTILLPGGAIYPEQRIVLSPFENDTTKNFNASKMFMGAQGIGPRGVMEADPLLVQAEQKLIGQADDLVVLADSSKLRQRCSLVLCPLARVSILITDAGIRPAEARMIEEAGVELIVADAAAEGSGAGRAGPGTAA